MQYKDKISEFLPLSLEIRLYWLDVFVSLTVKYLQSTSRRKVDVEIRSAFDVENLRIGVWSNCSRTLWCQNVDDIIVKIRRRFDVLSTLDVHYFCLSLRTYLKFCNDKRLFFNSLTTKLKSITQFALLSYLKGIKFCGIKFLSFRVVVFWKIRQNVSQ